MQNNIFLLLAYSIIIVLLYNKSPLSAKKYILFVGNILFYSLCDFHYLILIIFNSVWSFFWSQKISTSQKSRLALILGIGPIILSLCFFKYHHFFLPETYGSYSIIVPLGISYYSLKIISYLVDIYNHKCEAEKSFLFYFIYISFFPQIICGPISRSQEILQALHTPPIHISSDLIDSGICLIISGLFKKIVIADRLAAYVNSIFSSPRSYPSLALWMAAFFYAIQLYCDFCGYSEISIGVCKLMGINCLPNFNCPYLALNIKDFWRRWHISLSSWLKDYIYIPLGGNRDGIFKKNLRIFITFAISGIWHGSGINFFIWGAWHGFLNILPAQNSTKKMKQILSTALTFFLVMLGWIPFRATSLSGALQYILQMFTPCHLTINNIISSILPFSNDYSCLACLVAVSLMILLLFYFEVTETNEKKISSPVSVKYIIYFICIIFLGVFGSNSFLYRNF